MDFHDILILFMEQDDRKNVEFVFNVMNFLFLLLFSKNYDYHQKLILMKCSIVMNISFFLSFFSIFKLYCNQI